MLIEAWPEAVTEKGTGSISWCKCVATHYDIERRFSHCFELRLERRKVLREEICPSLRCGARAMASSASVQGSSSKDGINVPWATARSDWAPGGGMAGALKS